VSWPDERGWYEASRPRRVDGGIKARSKRGAIGEQWWSRRFIDVLESLGLSGRLARGRNYARAGQVLEFKLTQGKVTSRVQGSRAAPYKVQLGVLPLTTAQWRRVEEALASQALFRAKLLAGEMPHEIEDVFAECGTPLFPRSARDLDMSCSCPDYSVPCKHLAALCYVLAEAFDDDPFAVLAWRGRGREKLLAELRQFPAGGGEPGAAAGGAGSGAATGGGKSGAAAGGGEPGAAAGGGRSGAVGGGESGAGAGDFGPLAGLTALPLAECLESFWSAGMSPARLRSLPATPATAPDLLLRSFEPPDVRLRGKDLYTVLAPAYRRLTGADDPATGA
jgi:hypothetical protein